MKQTKIHLIGVESSGELSAQNIACIQNCRALILSSRHRDMLLPILGDLSAVLQIPIAPVREALKQAESALTHGDVAILATGDPLFFGIGRTLLDFFGPDRLLISPALSSMQLAFSRFKIPWDDAKFLSLHGNSRAGNKKQETGGISRPLSPAPCLLSPLLLNQDKLFLFTDHRSSPDRISQALLDECGSEINRGYLVHVAENLGLADEQLHTGTFSEIAKRTFGPLTVMIVIKTWRSPHPDTGFGLTEDEIVHSRGLITKNEVRAATLHELRLPYQGVFWDVGGGSGAISLEAARLFPGLQVFAVEREKEQIENIQENRNKFQVWNLQWLQGNAPDVLAALPDPDRVFIGGSGGHLRAIIEYATKRLLPGGRIVVNAVLEKTALEAPRFLHENGWHVTMSEIKVTRRRYPQAMDGPVSRDPGMDQERPQAMDGPVSGNPGAQLLHPITIIVGQKNRAEKNQDREKRDEQA